MANKKTKKLICIGVGQYVTPEQFAKLKQAAQIRSANQEEESTEQETTEEETTEEETTEEEGFNFEEEGFN